MTVVRKTSRKHSNTKLIFRFLCYGALLDFFLLTSLLRLLSLLTFASWSCLLSGIICMYVPYFKLDVVLLWSCSYKIVVVKVLLFLFLFSTASTLKLIMKFDRFYSALLSYSLWKNLYI